MYFGSSPYWKNAVVASPLGLTEPVNAAVVPPIDGGAPVNTGVGAVWTLNVAVTAVSAVIVT